MSKVKCLLNYTKLYVTPSWLTLQGKLTFIFTYIVQSCGTFHNNCQDYEALGFWIRGETEFRVTSACDVTCCRQVLVLQLLLCRGRTLCDSSQFSPFNRRLNWEQLSCVMDRLQRNASTLGSNFLLRCRHLGEWNYFEVECPFFRGLNGNGFFLRPLMALDVLSILPGKLPGPFASSNQLHV